MSRGTWDAIQALVTALKTINGVGYHLNFEERVFTRFLVPERVGVMPYACVFLEPDDGGDYPTQEPGWVVAHQSIKLAIFVPETSADAHESAAFQWAAKARDDVTKAVLSDPTLGGVVNEMRFGAVQTGAGQGAHGVLFFAVEWFQNQDAATLGP